MYCNTSNFKTQPNYSFISAMCQKDYRKRLPCRNDLMDTFKMEASLELTFAESDATPWSIHRRIFQVIHHINRSNCHEPRTLVWNVFLGGGIFFFLPHDDVRTKINMLAGKLLYKSITTLSLQIETSAQRLWNWFCSAKSFHASCFQRGWQMVIMTWLVIRSVARLGGI